MENILSIPESEWKDLPTSDLLRGAENIMFATFHRTIFKEDIKHLYRLLKARGISTQAEIMHLLYLYITDTEAHRRTLAVAKHKQLIERKQLDEPYNNGRRPRAWILSFRAL